MISEGPSWTYTTVVNIVFLGVAVVLVAHCLRTGDPAMLHLMNTPEDEMAQQDQAIAGIDHHVRRHETAMERMGHAGHTAEQVTRRRLSHGPLPEPRTAPPVPATVVAVRPGRLVEAVAIHLVALKLN
jgi:hypothetical protein